MKMMKVTTLTGEVFPGMLICGRLTDSRTGEVVKSADSWKEIGEKEYNGLCEKYGLD